VCDALSGYAQYFFDMGFSFSDNLEDFYSIFERLSVIYINRNQGDMIFVNNTFISNIGMFGGIISINSPDFTNL